MQNYTTESSDSGFTPDLHFSSDTILSFSISVLIFSASPFVEPLSTRIQFQF